MTVRTLYCALEMKQESTKIQMEMRLISSWIMNWHLALQY